MYRQFELKARGGYEMVTWLIDDPRLTVGRRLTLKGDDKTWTITMRYHRISDTPPETKWRVGGLE